MERTPNVDEVITVKRQCVCARFLHESTKYPRKGFEKVDEPSYTFHPGDQAAFVEEWTNFYGTYWRVRRGNLLYDLEPKNFLSYEENNSKTASE